MIGLETHSKIATQSSIKDTNTMSMGVARFCCYFEQLFDYWNYLLKRCSKQNHVQGQIVLEFQLPQPKFLFKVKKKQ